MLAIGLPGRLLIVLAVALLLTVALLIASGRIKLTSLILRLLLAWEVLLGVLAARLVAAGACGIIGHAANLARGIIRRAGPAAGFIIIAMRAFSSHTLYLYPILL